MKRYSILSAALLVFIACSGAASAFTLAEHEKNIEKYVQALNKSPEVVKTYCEMDGTVIEEIGALGGEDIVRYVQGENDSAIELRPAGGVAQLATRNPAFKLPDGTGVGDPIERVMKAALIPGDYSTEITGETVFHHWFRDGRLTMISEFQGKISSIFFLNDIKTKGLTRNQEYAKFLASGGGNEPAPSVSANRGGEDETGIFSNAAQGQNSVEDAARSVVELFKAIEAIPDLAGFQKSFGEMRKIEDYHHEWGPDDPVEYARDITSDDDPIKITLSVGVVKGNVTDRWLEYEIKDAKNKSRSDFAQRVRP